MEVLSQTEFNVSQRHRMDYIFYAKEAGERLLEIKELLKGATKTRPVETDLGTYISYSDFLDKNDICRKTAHNYTTLAENWEVVLKLGMQDKEKEENLGNSMRLCRTLEIIVWYKKKVEEGYPEDLLTLAAYWDEKKLRAQVEQEKRESRQKYIEKLEYEVVNLQMQIDMRDRTIHKLQSELEEYRKRYPKTIYDELYPLTLN
jgi:hypothetical protein